MVEKDVFGFYFLVYLVDWYWYVVGVYGVCSFVVLLGLGGEGCIIVMMVVFVEDVCWCMLKKGNCFLLVIFSDESG